MRHQNSLADHRIEHNTSSLQRTAGVEHRRGTPTAFQTA
jgi:hypothetical protein